MQGNNYIKLLLLLLLFALGALLSLFYGGTQEFTEYILWEIRLPKTVTAILAGSTLSVAGLILQVIFRNPLAGPYVLGISSGASLFVAFAIIGGSAAGLFEYFFLGKSLIILASVAGSLLITFLILALSKKISSNVILLLIGLMLAQICSAFQYVLEYYADPNDLKVFVMWGMGSLSGTTLQDLWIFVPVAALVLISVIFYIKPLQAFLLGEQYTINSGINYSSARFGLILIASVLTGLTTAFCGPVAFVGIAVPILSRMIFPSSSQGLHLLSCILIGSIMLLLADFLCHSSSQSTLPVNMVTTFIGAPLVIWLLFRNKQW